MRAKRLSIAPMMDWTNRHYRYFMRLITKKTILYTEMRIAKAILYGDRDYLLDFAEIEHPLCLQLGGDEPEELAEVARMAQDRGYDEINLNCGCPSERVLDGNFGVSLMAQPQRVARCVAAIMRAVKIPVSVKHRIGTENSPHYEDMQNFVRQVADAGCRHFIVHARIAIVEKRLDPRHNRSIPPLRYEDAYRLKEDFPELLIELNGGIHNLTEIQNHLRRVDGVMLGRAAYSNPYLFADIDSVLFGEQAPVASRYEIVQKMYAYIDEWQSLGLPPKSITRHMLGLFAWQRGNSAWKRYLSQNAYKPEAQAKVILEALEQVPTEVWHLRGYEGVA